MKTKGGKTVKPSSTRGVRVKSHSRGGVRVKSYSRGGGSSSGGSNSGGGSSSATPSGKPFGAKGVTLNDNTGEVTVDLGKNNLSKRSLTNVVARAYKKQYSDAGIPTTNRHLLKISKRTVEGSVISSNMQTANYYKNRDSSYGHELKPGDFGGLLNKSVKNLKLKVIPKRR